MVLHITFTTCKQKREREREKKKKKKKKNNILNLPVFLQLFWQQSENRPTIFEWDFQSYMTSFRVLNDLTVALHWWRHMWTVTLSNY